MRKLIHILAFCIFVLATSCQMRDLMDMSNTHYVRVYVDEQIKNVTTGFYDETNVRPVYEAPDVLRVMLADPETGNVKTERYLRNKARDEKGLYYDGYIIADPGEYTLLAYNFDTESTVIRNANNHKDLLASTNEIPSHFKTKIPSRATKSQDEAPEEIVYDPDHLFAANCGSVVIPYTDQIDTLLTEEGEHFHARTVVTSYFMQVRVKGIQYASSSVGLLTGMSGSFRVNDGTIKTDHPVTIYFEMLPGAGSAAGMRRSADQEAIIYTTFGTFGKLPEMKNELEITFDFLTVYGEPYSEAIDITDVFAKPEAIENHWLLIDHVIEIPPPPEGEGSDGGGFNPSVDEWENIETDIQI